jgi:hypothetical protein
MKSFGDIIDAFGGPVPFSQALGIADTHARTMKARNSIPPDHWAKLIVEAESRGIPVTFDLLTTLRALMRAATRPAPEQERAA